MDATSLEFKGIKRRAQAPVVRGNVATKARPVKENGKKFELIPGKLNGNHIIGKAVLVLLYAACVVLFVGAILMYVKCQSGLINSVDEIASLKNEYENLKKTNDEDLAAINNSIDNEEIRRVAIEELGMHYAAEGQIVAYSENYVNDYVRVVNVIK